MKTNLNRRQLLGGLSGVAGSTIIALPTVLAADKPNKAADGASLIIGPLTIDGWFLKSYKTLGKDRPKPEDVAKALAECRVYVLDRRVGPAGKEGRFAMEGYPKVAVEGKLAAKWKDGDMEYALHVAEVSIMATSTVFDDGLPYRKLGTVTVKIDMRGTGGPATWEARYSFSSKDHAAVYDITGADRS